MALVTKNFSDIITFTRASTATFFNSAGVLQSAAINAPRFDYNPSTLAAQGLLIEEARTNSIRNNTMVGAVAGTPGTLPQVSGSPSWVSNAVTSGITQELIGTGTENGITYIDFRFSGTATQNNFVVSAELHGQIVATNGQSWAGSWFVKVIASPAPFATYTNRIRLNDSGGSGVGQIDTVFTPTSALTRYTSAGTIAAATTAFIQPQIRFGMTVGVAYDATIRIGLPQLELGAFATSVIPTTTTALTRNADVASVNTLSPWFNATEGTLFVRAAVGSTAATAIRLAAIDDGTTGNVIRFASGTVSFQVLNAGSVEANLVLATLTDNVAANVAGAYKANDFAASINGGAAVTDNSGTIPTVNRLILGAASGVNPRQTWIQRLTYYPRRLSNAELVSITTP